MKKSKYNQVIKSITLDDWPILHLSKQAQLYLRMVWRHQIAEANNLPLSAIRFKHE